MITVLLAFGSLYSFISGSAHLAALLGGVAIVLVAYDTLFGEEEVR